MKKVTPNSSSSNSNPGFQVQVRVTGGTPESNEEVEKLVKNVLAQLPPPSSSSSSTPKPLPSDVHKGKDIYFIRAGPANTSIQMSGDKISTRIVVRMTKELFSEKAQAAMPKVGIKNANECRLIDQEPDLSKRDVDRIIDIYRHPTKAGMCQAYKIQDVAFVKMMKATPTGFVKMVEEDLCKEKGSVALVEQGKTGFQKGMTVNNHVVHRMLFDTEGVPDTAIAKTLAGEMTAEREVLRKQGKFEGVLSEALGKNPILPEEKIFTGLRALAYQKSQQPLESFYQVIDAIEFRLRNYCAAGKADAKQLQALSHFIREELERFPQKNQSLVKIYEALEAMYDVISIVQSEKYSEDYAPTVHKFLVQILGSPLRDQLKCTVPVQNVREIAAQNLTLRSGLLLSQFKTSLQETCPAVLQDLEKIDAAFRKDDWVTANALLCEVMESDFFKGVAAEIPRNFADQKAFAPYKLAAGIVNLADFFNEVVKASPHYQWINFPMVNQCLGYLNQPEKALEKGKLTLLGQWVKQLHEAGYTELSEESKHLSSSLQKFDELKAKFEKGKFSDWLHRVQNKMVDPQEYQGLCQIIDHSYKEIEELLREISLHVNLTQALVVLFAGKKGVPPIEKEKLAEQLTYLNEKINHTCLPFISFLHNFKMLMVKGKAAPNVYALTTFETSPAKLFPSAEPIQIPEENSEVKVVDESDDSEDEAVPQAVDTLDKELKEVFSTNNRRKILENLSAFFKEHNRKVKVEAGKGSHIKIYLGKVPIIIPHSKELKVGTAGSIRSDILDELRKLA